jgi:hypothetical protein
MVAGAILAACGSGSSAGTAGHDGRIGSIRATVPQFRPTPLPATVCEAFKDFYTALSSTSPRSSQVDFASSVDEIGNVADLDPQSVSRQVLNDVQSLVRYVNSSTFPTQGSIEGAPVQQLVSDCF